MLASPFLFALCQHGAERVVRDELTARGFAPSFSAPGFVTAKAASPLRPEQLPSLVFARRVCLSLVGEIDVAALVADLRAVLHRASGERGRAARSGEHVVTVVEASGGSRPFVGVHVHREGLSPDPCGDPALVVPDATPSRAWLKFEEAARLWDIPLQAGDSVVEVGCSPGGMSRALLDRGAVVTGIDKNAMDPRILADPRFHHVRCSVRHVEASLLTTVTRGPVRLFVMDVNLPPHSALSAVGGVLRALRPTLRAGLFTLKLGDYRLVPELPRWRARIEAMTGLTTTATQLPSNRQELTVYAARV